MSKNAKNILRLTFVLFLVSAVIALALGAVNMVTKDRIDALQKAALDAAMQEVLPADAYTELKYAGGDERIDSVYSAGEQGHVVQATVSGSQGNITMIVGVSADGTVSGISIINSSETSGMGAIASSSGADGQAFRAQFVGKTEVSVDKDGGEIDAITSATITSRAICDGVNAAQAAIRTLG